MISIEQLKTTLSNTNFKQIKLPNETSSYIQTTYSDLRSNKSRYEEVIKQQQAIKEAVETGIEVNVIKSDNIDGFDNLVKKEDKRNYRIANVKYSSYLNYSENSTFDLPEDLLELLGEQVNDTVKLYGIKNPNSFIKSVILLNEPNYMVFNKYQMNQAVFKWRTDLAYHYKNNTKSFSKLPRADLQNLETTVLRENFHNSAVAQLAASHTGKNIIILDYINKQYEVYLANMKNHILYSGKTIENWCNTDDKKYYLIIKYQDCYLPCLKIDNNNEFKFLVNYKKLELTNNRYYHHEVIDIILPDEEVEEKQDTTSNLLANDNTKKETVKETKMISTLIDINKIKRDALQRIAIAYDIDIMKPGSKPGSKIKKTKQDFMNEFKMVVYDPVKLSVDNF